MASLIRLKQIESGSSLEQAAEVGSDFSGAVYQIIDGAGLFSSSVQVDLVEASNYDGFVVQLDMTMSSDLEASIISSSISQSVALLSQTYVTTASLNQLSSSLAVTDSQSLYLIGLLSSSVQATTGDFSSSVASQFSSSYATIYSISSSMNTTINNLSSSVATSLSASEAGQTALSASIATTITNLSSSFDTTIDNLSSSIFTSLSASEAGQTALSGAISITINNLSSSVATSLSASEANIISISSSINTSISSSNARFAGFSSSIDNTILNKINAVGVISSSAQLDGSTLKGITIAPINSDGYSLIISGALAVVDATGLPDGGFGDNDSTVPAQIYLDGNTQTTESVPPPIDPSTNNQANSNQIDMGEF
jgi:hypothetical protein